MSFQKFFLEITRVQVSLFLFLFFSNLALASYQSPLIYIDPTGEVGIVAQDELKAIDELSRSDGTLNDPSPGLNALINEYGLNDYLGSRHIWQGKTGREQQFVSNKGIRQLAKLLEDANNGYAKASSMMVIENGDSPEAAFEYVNDYVGHVSDDTKQALMQYTSGVQRGDLLDVSFAYDEGMYRANDRVWLNKVSSGLKGVRSQLPWLLQNYTSVHQAGIDIVAGTESMIRHNSLNTLSERAPKPMRDTANAELVISGILGTASRFVKLPVSGLPKNIEKLAEANITNSGKTVLGHYPKYIDKAKDRGASYFNIGNAWDSLTDYQRWAANKHFLDIITESGDQVLLSVPKTKIIPDSSLTKEINYITNEKNYYWVNQWALEKK